MKIKVQKNTKTCKGRLIKVSLFLLESRTLFLQFTDLLVFSRVGEKLKFQELYFLFV